MAIGGLTISVTYVLFKVFMQLGYLRISQFEEIVGTDLIRFTSTDAFGLEDNFKKDSLKFQNVEERIYGLMVKEIEEREKMLSKRARGRFDYQSHADSSVVNSEAVRSPYN